MGSRVKEAWREAHGRYPTQEDVDNMYADFVPMTLATLPKYSGLIPGTADVMANLRSEFNLKIGLTTGFTKVLSEVLIRDAEKQGFVLDACVSGDEVDHGVRPDPHMLYKNLDLMGVSPIQSVVKVDDTSSGIGEAQNAGCWGVGVARWCNYMDVDSLEHETQLSEEDIQKRLQKSRDILIKAGAHYVVDSVVDLPEVVRDINARLARGEKP